MRRNNNSPTHPRIVGKQFIWKMIAPSLACGILCLAGCSHVPTLHPEEKSEEKSQESRIELSYELGHSHRRLVAEEKNNSIAAKTFLEHQIVAEGVVEAARYYEFFAKISEYVKKKLAQGSTTSPLSCRARYVLTVQKGSEKQVLKGCRSDDEAGLSHLIKEGELLLYSKK